MHALHNGPFTRMSCAVLLSLGASVAAANTNSAWDLGLPAADSDHEFPMAEGQIAVVAPGTNKACSSGRMILANDGAPTPAVDGGVTHDILGYRDLNAPAAPMTAATLTAASANAKEMQYTSNDQNLLSLADGRIVWSAGEAYGHLPGTPAPWWWDYTERGDLKKGARAAQATYISDDCGKTYTFAESGTLDTYFTEGDVCANPQPEEASKIETNPDGTTSVAPPFGMGGFDGSRFSMNPARNRIFVTLSCVGRLPGPMGKDNKPRLSDKFVDKSDIYTSTVDAANHFAWKRIGRVAANFWRAGVVELFDKSIAVADHLQLWIGRPLSQDSYAFEAKQIPLASWGWSRDWRPLGTQGVADANMLANSEVTRWPAHFDGALIFVPTDVPTAQPVPGCVDPKSLAIGNFGTCGKLSGYRVFAYRTPTGKIEELSPSIIPRHKDGTPNPKGMVAQLSISDPGKGPVLVHWYDVDQETGESLVRARLYTEEDAVQEMVLSRAASAPRSFTLSRQASLLDFKGGDAYLEHRQLTKGKPPASVPFANQAIAHFFPLWIEIAAPGVAHAHTIEVTATLTVPIDNSHVLKVPHRNQAIPVRVKPGDAVMQRVSHSWLLHDGRIPANVVNPRYLPPMDRERLHIRGERD